VLDGGITAWVAEGRPTSRGPGAHTSTSVFTPRFDPSVYASKSDVRAALELDSAQIVDARMDVAYRAASGHIPGAVRVTGLGFLGPDGHWKSPEECRQRVLDAGVDPDRPTILYCGGGVAATGAYLGWLRAGISAPLRVYDGSWGEWEQDPETPKDLHS
jgi:thiosulfate/3-mercaptopyruvate sulfurtransferase